jgi:hypothetical protein
LTTVSSHFFKNLLLLAIFILSRTVKKLSTATRRKSDFLPIKTKNYFSINLIRPGSGIRDPDPGSGSGIRNPDPY